MAGSLQHGKHARKRHWSVPAWLGHHRPATLLSVAGVVVLAPLLIVAPFGNAAAPSPSTVKIGTVTLLPPGTTVVGPAAVSAPLSLDVVLAPQNPTALAGFINELYDPASAEYHDFLAPGQFGPEFGATQSTIQSVSSALTSLGLTPGQVTSNDLDIPVSTTVAKAQAAFDISIDDYSVAGRAAYANTAAPEVPASIAGDITDIIGLSDVAQAQSSIFKPSSGSHPASSVQPDTSGPTPCADATDTGYSTADQLAHAYGFDTGAYAGGRLGAGETVALAELEPFESSDLSAYESCYGISTTVDTTNVDGGPGTGFGSGESIFDIEDVAGLAPDATIDVYQGAGASLDDLYDVYDAIATDDTAQVTSSSWGLCEALTGSSFIESEEPIFEQMATQGQSIVVASGDTGSSECYRANESDELNVQDASSDPYVTGVGGTQFTEYGPPPNETAWNEDPGTSGAGGGGISTVWQMPTYQQALGINADSSGTPCGAPAGTDCREVPDVSALAGSPFYSVYYEGAWGGIGGTSLASPLWAAFTSLADEGCSAPAGFLNPTLYTHSGDLNDITSGNNDDTTSGYTGGLYPATAGYDMATGLGSPTAALFAPGVLCSGKTNPPAITKVSPTSGPTTGNTTVTITGTNFTGATKVLFGNVAAKSFSVVSATEITAVSPAEAAALHNIYVTTPGGTSATVTADQYTFVGLPAITSLSPTSGPTTGNTTVTITGTSFTGATKVLFGNVAAKSFSVVSSTEITAVSPAEAAALHNTYVTTPVGTSATVTADQYTFVGLPAITSLSPTSGPTTGNTTVTITGTGFTGATKVLFGNVAAKSFSVVSSTEITAVSPAEAAALHNIYVTTPVGTSATVTADEYTFVAVPAITKVSPSSGPTTGNTTVTITGTGFTGATKVLFGNVAAKSFSVVSSTEITAVSPAEAAALHNIYVTTPEGTSATVTADEYTFVT